MMGNKNFSYNPSSHIMTFRVREGLKMRKTFTKVWATCKWQMDSIYIADYYAFTKYQPFKAYLLRDAPTV
jgi:hypothetical protein